MLGKPVRFMLLTPFLPAMVAFSYEAVLSLTRPKFEDLMSFVLGIAACLLPYAVLPVGRIRFVETLEHELTHAVASLMVFHMPSKLVVDPDGVGERLEATFEP